MTRISLFNESLVGENTNKGKTESSSEVSSEVLPQTTISYQALPEHNSTTIVGVVSNNSKSVGKNTNMDKKNLATLCLCGV